MQKHGPFSCQEATDRGLHFNPTFAIFQMANRKTKKVFPQEGYRVVPSVWQLFKVLRELIRSFADLYWLVDSKVAFRNA